MSFIRVSGSYPKIAGRLKAEQYAPRWQVLSTFVIYAVAVLALVLLTLFIIQWRNSIDDGERRARNDAQDKTAAAAAIINDQLDSFTDAVTEFAAATEALEFADENFGQRADIHLRNNLDLHRVGALFAPEDGDLSAPFSARRVDPNSLVGFVHGLEEFDYTVDSGSDVDGIENPNRYSGPVVEGRSWTRPYYDQDFQTTISEHGVKIVEAGGEPAGIVYAQISTTTLESNVSWGALRETGYGFLVSADGVFISHPADERLSGASSVFDPGEDDAFRVAVAGTMAGESGTVDYVDEITGADTWIAYEPITTTGWTLGYVVFKDHVIVQTSETRRALMRLAAAVILLVFSIVFLTSRAYAGSLGGLWITSLVLSGMFAGGLLMIWYWEDRTPDDLDPERTNIGSSVAEFKEQLKEEFGETAIEARVGTVIESLEFVSVDNVSVTGRAWEAIDNLAMTQEIRGIEQLQTLRPALVIPGARGVRFEQLFTRLQGTDRQVGWLFESEITAEFDFAKYPFDRAEVSLPLEHRELGRGVIAIPDLDSYDTLLPDDKPGVLESVAIAGWDIDSSFFNYDTVDFGADMGLLRPIATRNHPSLSFNIRLSRSFFGPLISNVLPLGIVTALLFMIMMITTKMEGWVLGFAGNVTRTGRSLKQMGDTVEGGGPSYSLIATSTVMAYSGALLFAVILAHARLRGQFPDAGLLYLEFLYFVVYVAIFAVSLNALAFAAHRGGPLVHFRENLLPRVMFWPIVTGYGFVTAWLTFY